jgi:uncharacterized protein
MRSHFAGARAATLFAALLISAACVHALAAAVPERYGQGLLWKVEAAGVAPSYVFGTAHLSDPRVTRLPQPVRESFDAAKSFAMEVSQETVFQQLGKRMVYSGKRSLPAALGQPLYEQVAPLITSAGVPRQLVPRLKPWAATFFLMGSRDSGTVLDQQLYLRARAQKKPVYELETVSEAIAPFANLSESDQIVLLRDTLAQSERMGAAEQVLIGLYLKGDLAALARLMDEAIPDGPKAKLYRWVFWHQLLDVRNVNMARRMDVLAKTGGAFMAVGALHLYGDSGVLALLEKRGYRLTRVY